jgi:hypothetical protein
MGWEVEYTDEFEDWWIHLTEGEQDADRLYDEHLKALETEENDHG